MADNVVIYSSFDPITSTFGPNYAGATGAQAIGTDGHAELKAALSRLRSEGARIERLTFIFHGSAGALHIADDSVLSGFNITGYAGNGFEDLFVPGAVVSFDICKVARGFRGQDFLLTFAKTFLFKAGGYVVGWDSDGFVFRSLGPLYGSGSGVHRFLGGDT